MCATTRGFTTCQLSCCALSCIAGPRQFGTEDQGWVAHFLYSVLERKPITIYGDGFQVRDVLHVHDLVEAMQAVRRELRITSGQVFNIGGGPGRAISVVEMLRAIAAETGVEPVLQYRQTRPGDQPLYVSSLVKLTQQTGWQPRRSLRDILDSIHRFWRENRSLLASQRDAKDLPELAARVVA